VDKKIDAVGKLMAYPLHKCCASDWYLIIWEDVMKAEPMQVDEKDYEDVVVLRVRGVLAYRPNVSHFYDRLDQLKQMGRTRVVVDCSGLTGCGAALLGWLVSGQKMLREVGGDLCLSGLSVRMSRILKVMQLSDRFATFKTTDRAVSQLHKRQLMSAA
jgi:anti-anti-sigma factor